MSRNPISRSPNIITSVIEAYPVVRNLSQMCRNYLEVEQHGGDDQQRRDHGAIQAVLKRIKQPLPPRIGPREDLQRMGRVLAWYVKRAKKAAIVLNQDSGWQLASVVHPIHPSDTIGFAVEYRDIIGYLLPDDVREEELTVIIGTTRNEIDPVALGNGSTYLLLVMKNFLDQLLENENPTLWSRIKALSDFQPSGSTSWLMQGNRPSETELGAEELKQETVTVLLALLSDSNRFGNAIMDCDSTNLSRYATSLLNLGPQDSD